MFYNIVNVVLKQSFEAILDLNKFNRTSWKIYLRQR